MIQVKVCCIATLAEARLALRAGASALGLVGAMPSGPGVIDEDRIAAIARAVRGQIDTFLLTSHVTADAILEQHARCRTTTIQLVDRLREGELRRLRRRVSGLRLVQVVHVADQESVEEAGQLADSIDHILLDSGRPDATVKELGGTGRTHDWSVSRQIVERVSVPVWLAGGLNPSNVVDAVRAVRPHGVDVCSGLRTGGALAPVPLDAFVQAVRSI